VRLSSIGPPFSPPNSSPSEHFTPQVTPHEQPGPTTKPQNSPKSTGGTHIVPPSSMVPRGPTPKPQKKSLKSKWPCTRSFAIQRRIQKFLQNIKLQLVTLISVCLRDLPFSEPGPKTQFPKKLSNFPSVDPIFGSLSSSLIRGPHPDLILFVTRFNITHFPIYSFIQDFF
jgi:hypothetical protein